jgi:hypothetical protein
MAITSSVTSRENTARLGARLSGVMSVDLGTPVGVEVVQRVQAGALALLAEADVERAVDPRQLLDVGATVLAVPGRATRDAEAQVLHGPGAGRDPVDDVLVVAQPDLGAEAADVVRPGAGVQPSLVVRGEVPELPTGGHVGHRGRAAVAAAAACRERVQRLPPAGHVPLADVDRVPDDLVGPGPLAGDGRGGRDLAVTNAGAARGGLLVGEHLERVAGAHRGGGQVAVLRRDRGSEVADLCAPGDVGAGDRALELQRPLEERRHLVALDRASRAVPAAVAAAERDACGRDRPDAGSVHVVGIDVVEGPPGSSGRSRARMRKVAICARVTSSRGQ